MSEILYGRNAARETLRARRRHIHRLMVADNIESSAIINEILELAGRLKISVQRVARNQLDKIAKGHQGIGFEVAGGEGQPIMRLALCCC